MSTPQAQPPTLPPIAARVDHALAEIDEQIDWLHNLSPVDNDAMWAGFVAGGFDVEPSLRYHELCCDLTAVRERLLALPVDRVEIPLIQALLLEKQRELDRLIELLELRGTDGFVVASIDLFGGTDPVLLRQAEEILARVPADVPEGPEATGEDFAAAAEAELAHYRERAPDLRAQVVMADDLNSLMMVNHGDLYVARSARLPAARVAPLIAHEIGTHVVTRHNGRKQALRQLEVGLAHYDSLQEGLGTLAEYLAGYLPAERLRVIAARVVAADMAVHRRGVVEIFARLHEQHELPAHHAFDVAVRARRGGGLTKDAVYLEGLRDLLAYLAEGGELESLYLGKFPLAQRSALEELRDAGWVHPPELLPRHLEDPAARARLDRVACVSLTSLHQAVPES